MIQRWFRWMPSARNNALFKLSGLAACLLFALGWHAQSVDGNDLDALVTAFDTARTLTDPKCNGSGTCNANMTTEMRACDLAATTTCGPPITGRLGPCVRTGLNCTGDQDIEDVTYTCDGSGTCDENVTVTGTQGCNMPAGTTCSSGNTCDGSGNCD